MMSVKGLGAYSLQCNFQFNMLTVWYKTLRLRSSTVLYVCVHVCTYACTYLLPLVTSTRQHVSACTHITHILLPHVQAHTLCCVCRRTHAALSVCSRKALQTCLTHYLAHYLAHYPVR